MMEHKTDWKLNDTVMPEDMNRIESNNAENADAMLKKDGSVQMTGVLKTVGGAGIAEQIELHNCHVYTDSTGHIWFASNLYFNGTEWRYKTDGAGIVFSISGSEAVLTAPLLLYVAEPGLKDAVATLSQTHVLTTETGLPLTGGTLTGDCHVIKNTPTLRLINSTGNVGYLQCQEDNVTTLGAGNSSETDTILVWLTPWAEQAKKIMMGIQNSGAWIGHLIYGTHNITCSTTTPPSALTEGAQHQVY